MKTERFKFIKNFEGRYSISSEGRVFSHLSETFRIPVLTKRITEGGEQVKINLCKACRVTTFRIKRLVAQAFIPNPENKPEVININGNPMDCRVENLKWVTKPERFKHVFADTGKLRNFRSARHKTSKGE